MYDDVYDDLYDVYDGDDVYDLYMCADIVPRRLLLYYSKYIVLHVRSEFLFTRK